MLISTLFCLEIPPSTRRVYCYLEVHISWEFKLDILNDVQVYGHTIFYDFIACSTRNTNMCKKNIFHTHKWFLCCMLSMDENY